MIISHKYKYVFVELPRTGSTAIAAELRENYDSVRILKKHSTYNEFLKVASPEEKKYFVFSSIRNPMDDAVSAYFKYKNDHKNNYSDPAKLGRTKVWARYVDKSKFNYIHSNDASFPDFFLKFYFIPYNNWSELLHEKFDFVIRFENLAEDFAKALELIGIEQKRPLPLINKTAGKNQDFTCHYTPKTVSRAKHVFGPFMEKWDYEFPVEWGNCAVPWRSRVEFEFFNVFRRFYWNHLR